MKYFFLLLSAAFLSLMAFTANPTTILSGKITDDSGEPLIGATIRVLRGADLVGATITDYNGEYRVPLDSGTYTVEVSYTGFQTKHLPDVRVLNDQTTKLDVSLESGAALSEVVVVSKNKARQKTEKTPPGEAVTGAPGKKLPASSVNAIVGTTAGSTSTDDKATGRRTESKKLKRAPAAESSPMVTTPTSWDAAKELPKRAAAPEPALLSSPPVVKDELDLKEMPYSVADAVPAAEMIKVEDAEAGEPTPGPGTLAQPAPHAGLLTAGEWNDLHNWSKHWVDLLADGETDTYQRMYQFFPKNRYSVFLQNDQDLPISDAPVQLLDSKGNARWEARTDNLGRAELWNGMTGEPATGNLSIVAWVDGKKHDLGRAKPFAEGLNRAKIQRECQHSSNVDIVWAVDATGSMGDELEYLKTELLDVIGRVQSTNPNLAVRMGSVFYRDEGDAYVVKASPLNADIAKTVDYIRQQSADGGGDYPEAVHSALEEAIYRQSWSKEAITRICFLVLDASPHQGADVTASLQKSIREAAKKGIRIVPVTASGIQKDTEFLMKFFGLATNGTYVFLTDHSGIGGKHLEPTTDEYTVELLNDLLVRLITEYATVPSCAGKSSIRFENQQAQTGQQQANPLALGPITYFPNPASVQFTLEIPFDADKVTLYDAEGKAVRTFAQLAAGTHSIPVNDLSEGFYTLRIWKGGQVQSGKVVVVRA